MTPAAREALEMAAAEHERLAIVAETVADLYRQAAGLLRQGEIDRASQVREQMRQLMPQVGGRLAAELVESIRARDPDLWRDQERLTELRLVRAMSLDALRMYAPLHQMFCRDQRCEVMRVIAERLSG